MAQASPPPPPAGPTGSEAAAAARLLAAANVDVAYEADGDNEGLYLGCGDGRAVVLAAEWWTAHADPRFPWRLMLIEAAPPLSELRIELADCGPVQEVALHADQDGIEVAARVDFWSGAQLFAWAAGADYVAYDIHAWPAHLALQSSRNLHY